MPSSSAPSTPPTTPSHSGYSTPLSAYSPNSPWSARSSQYVLDLAADAATYSRKLTSSPSPRLTRFADWLKPGSRSRGSSDPDDFRSRLDTSQRHMLSLGAAQPVIDELYTSGRSDMVDELHARLRSVIDSPPHSTQSAWSGDRPPSYAESVRWGSPPSYVSPLSTSGTRSTVGGATTDTASETGTRDTNGLPTPQSSRRSSLVSDFGLGARSDWTRSHPPSPSAISPARQNPWTWAELGSSSDLVTPPQPRSPSPPGSIGRSRAFELADTSSPRSSVRSRRTSNSSTPVVELPTTTPSRAYELDAGSQPGRYRQRQQYIHPSSSVTSRKLSKRPRPSTKGTSRRKNILNRISRHFSSVSSSECKPVRSRPSRHHSLSYTSAWSPEGVSSSAPRQRLGRRSGPLASTRSSRALRSAATALSSNASNRPLPDTHPSPLPSSSSSEQYRGTTNPSSPSSPSRPIDPQIAALTSTLNAHSRAQSSSTLLRLHAEHTRSPTRTADSLWTAHTADTLRSLDPGTLRTLASLSEKAERSGVTYTSMAEFAASGRVVPFYRGHERLRAFKRAWTEATSSVGSAGMKREDVKRLMRGLGAVQRDMRR